MMGNQPLRRDLVEMAVKFLVTVGVHDGRAEEVPAEDKVKFLKDKGLTDAEIREAQRMVRSERTCMVVVLVLFVFWFVLLLLPVLGAPQASSMCTHTCPTVNFCSEFRSLTPTSQTRRSR